MRSSVVDANSATISRTFKQIIIPDGVSHKVGGLEAMKVTTSTE
jgi:hypothetical protein